MKSKLFLAAAVAMAVSAGRERGESAAIAALSRLREESGTRQQNGDAQGFVLRAHDRGRGERRRGNTTDECTAIDF